MRSPWKSLSQRLARTADEDLAESLAVDAVRAGCTPIAQARQRDEVSLHGTITMVTVNPRGVNKWLEARLGDGTGEVTLIWMGRRLVRGIEGGRRLEVTGRLTTVDGRPAIYNPKYTLLPSQG